jgi:signal transduction histidine kinase
MQVVGENNPHRTSSAWESLRRDIPRLITLFLCVWFTTTIASGQTQQSQNVLIITEVGISYSLTNSIVEQIDDQVHQVPGRHVELYTESLDLMSLPNQISQEEMRDWLSAKYSRYKLDAIVAVGPETVDFLSTYAPDSFAKIPIVICGTSAEQLANPKLSSRFAGTWLKFEPEKTIEVALRLFPDTRYVYVVGGSSAFDKKLMSLTNAKLSGMNTKAEIRYFPEMEMGHLATQLQQLPPQSILLYTSFFRDSAGVTFLNATKALPMIASASKVPTFGMTDTYMGHGIVGGYLMPFEMQVTATAQVLSDVLQGKRVQSPPTESIPGAYVFDGRELQKWDMPENRLPPKSVILFREPGFWERTKWLWAIILALSIFAGYLLYSRKQLKLAKDSQRLLSGRLINAQEEERGRLAREIHDDFSQRLAVVALQLENIGEAVPASYEEVHRQLIEVEGSASELATELHSLSYRLHSSTLEHLGLVPAVSSLCKEFTSQQGVKVNFVSNEVPRSVAPDVALCAFRIVQEALRNIKRHSDAKNAFVQLTLADKLEICIRDDGHGFDLSHVNQRQGLGIRSMEERAISLGGIFKIHSEFGAGTTVRALLPLKRAAYFSGSSLA